MYECPGGRKLVNRRATFKLPGRVSRDPATSPSFTLLVNSTKEILSLTKFGQQGDETTNRNGIYYDWSALSKDLWYEDHHQLQPSWWTAQSLSTPLAPSSWLGRPSFWIMAQSAVGTESNALRSIIDRQGTGFVRWGGWVLCRWRGWISPPAEPRVLPPRPPPWMGGRIADSKSQFLFCGIQGFNCVEVLEFKQRKRSF